MESQNCIFVCVVFYLRGMMTDEYNATQGNHSNKSMDFRNISATIENLLNGYDLRLRPHFAGEPLGVYMDVVIASFDSISEVDMDYTITLYLNQHWNDPRLKFPYGNESLTLPAEFADRIWLPDTFFANDKNSYLHEVTEKNKMLKLYPNGSIIYGMRFTTTLACMMDLRNYPLDEQNCTIEIESYGYTTDDVNMYWRRGRESVEGVERVSLPQFTITDYQTIITIEYLTTGIYGRLSLSFKLQRNIGYFIFQTYLPSILIVMLSWVSFWINHEATSARVALGITTVLTMTTISNGVRQSLPRISYVKAIDIYIVVGFVFVFSALLEYAAVNYQYWGSRYKRKKAKNKEQNMRNAHKDDVEDIELKPTNMSPILGLRNQNSNNTNIESYDNNIPSLRMSPAIPRTYMRAGQIHTQLYRRKNGTSQKQRRRKLLSEFREKARSIGKISIPKVKDVNTIDKYSRILFPLLFSMFNCGYWIFYTMK